MKKLLAVAVVLLATNHAHAGQFTSPSSSGPVIITNDGGGVVTTYQDAVYRYNTQHRRVEIRGSCRSACTLALAVNNVCVASGAILKWHHAYNPATGAPVYSVTNDMMAMTPTKIRRLVEPNIGINYNPNATLNYQQLVALGVPDCAEFRDHPTTYETTVASSKPAHADVDGIAFKKSDLINTKATQSNKRTRHAKPAQNPIESFVKSLWAF
jgi:hypothetical protein